MNILPYIINLTITPIVVSVLASIAILFMAYRSRTVILSTLARVGSGLWTRTGFFWAVNFIFMAVSVLHAGSFFGITGNAHSTPGIGQFLGFAVSFFLDLVTIILMQAMLEARYRGEVSRARQFLLFITICCATSTFANLAISLNDFDAQIFLPHAPLWIQVASPYVLASFPLFVIMMSLAAEMILHVRPLEKLEEKEYEADEKKRVKIMEIRNNYLQKQVEEDLRALVIRAQMKQNRQMHRPSLFPVRQKATDIQTIVAQATQQFQQQIAELKQQLAVQLNQSTIQVVQIQQPQQPEQQQDNVVISDDTIQSDVVALPVENDVAVLDDMTQEEKSDVVLPFPVQSNVMSDMTSQKSQDGNTTRQRILDYVALHPGAKQSEVATACNVTVRTVQRYLKKDDTTLTHDAGGLVLDAVK